MSLDPVHTAGLDGRRAACAAILAALSGRQYAAEKLRALRAAGRLGEPEAGLAMEIALGTLRHLLTIEHVLSAIAEFDKRHVRKPLRVILYAAAYQIIWMDRIPHFAAVDEAVKQAGGEFGRRAANMVNAILRRLTRAIADRRVPWQPRTPTHVRVSWDRACAFGQAVLPPAEGDTAIAHLAVATSERVARYQTLVARHGPELAEQLAWASQAPPVTIVQRNPLRCTAQEFAAELGAELGEDVELYEGAAFVAPSRAVARLSAFEKGWFYVQDTVAHEAAELVDAGPGERILDLCAAPGGKSVAMALQMGDRGEVVACDASAERLARVRENCQRLGISCVRTAPSPCPPRAAAGQNRPPEQALGFFDAALVDVPCSNSGVLARRPEARFRLSRATVDALVGKQIELLTVAAGCVRPGGRLVYSTCSLEPEENEQLVARFLEAQPDWRLDFQRTVLPAWGPRLSDWRDGGFAARLLRR